MKQDILEYQMQRSLLELLFHKNLVTQVEYQNIKAKLDRKYKNTN
ncbi:SHOCT domain-containing protein [Streptococcus suis]